MTHHRLSLVAVALLALFGASLYASQSHAQQAWSLTATATHVQNGDSVTISISGTPPDANCSYTNLTSVPQTVTPPPDTTTTYSMNCGIHGSSSIRIQASAEGPAQPPTASITAAPTSITGGSSTLLEWLSTETASCSVTNRSSGAQVGSGTSGSVSVSPTTSTYYDLNCTKEAGNPYSDPSDYVYIGVSPPEFDVQCSVNPASAGIGESVTWFANVTGGLQPFTYAWTGESLTGKSGSSVSTSYASAGEKQGNVTVTDSSNSGGTNVSHSDGSNGSICTGSLITTYITDFHDESEGFEDPQAIQVVRLYAESAFATEPYESNPENYCMQEHVYQECDPNKPSLVCTYRLRVTVHSGQGTRAATSDDYFTDGSGWTRDRFWGTALGETYTTGPQTVSNACTNSVTVAADAPTASLSANPISIVEGSSSTLTSACTNATSATIDNGVGTVNASGSDTRTVTPGSSTTYVLTCTGDGGTTTASATVTVTPPTLTASCSVSPTSVTAGESATWTASPVGGTGSYTYSWSGTDDLTGSTQSVARTYSTAGTKTASVTVTSGAQTVTQACSNSVTVGAAAQADLTAGSITPTSARQGEAVTLSATASNVGSASSGSFPMLFQIESPAELKNSSYLSALAAGASAPASVSHTFASDGTYRVRACANFNTSWTAITTESNYDNNCGPWTTISVAVAATDTLSCSVSSGSVPVGGSVTYTASGASAPYTWSPSDGQGSYGTGATATRTFSTAGSYGMSVSASGATAANCPVVVVGTAACTNPSTTITASPDRVRAGQTATVTWSATGVDGSCTVTGPGVNQTITGNACIVPSGSATPTITAQSVYTISCDGGESTDQVVVNLIPEFVEF